MILSVFPWRITPINQQIQLWKKTPMNFCVWISYSFLIKDCFSLEIEEITFPLYPHIVEAEDNLELQYYLSTNIRTNINKANYDWKCNMVEGINLVYYRDRIYVPKTLRNFFLKWYHFYLQHPGGDRPSQTLNTVCMWSGIFDQARKLCRIFK